MLNSEYTSPWRSRIGWRIALSIFLSVFIIQAVSLIPSYYQRENDALNVMEMASLTATHAVFHQYPSKDKLKQLLTHGKELTDNSLIKGLGIYDASGHYLATIGETPQAGYPSNYFDARELVGKYNGYHDRYAVSWSARDLGSPFLVVGLLDSSQVNHTLWQDLLRVLGLVILVTFAVTLIAYYVVVQFVLKPVMRLRRNVVAAAENLDRPDSFTISGTAQGEIKDIFAAVNVLLNTLKLQFARLNQQQEALDEQDTYLEQRVKERTGALQSMALFPSENTNPILRVASNGELLYANEASKPILAHWKVEVGERLPKQWSMVVHDALQSGLGEEFEIKCSDRVFGVQFSPINDSNYVNVYANDITERKRSEEELINLVNQDLITGLPNRGLFNDRLSQAISYAKENNKLVAVLLFSVNEFKDLNETMGHHYGDRLLRAVAKRMRNNFPDRITIARLHGNEFGLIDRGINDVSDAANIATQLINLYSEPFRVASYEIPVTVSIGISVYPIDETTSQIVRNADLALYRARSKGRNQYQFYVAGMNAEIETRRKLMLDLRHAIKRDQLQLYYQPQICLQTGRIIGAEALLRWQHPENGLISPMDFIPLAETSGLIIPIGEWILQQACQQTRLWRDSGFSNIRVAINLSAEQFHQSKILQMVGETVSQAGISPHNLELEITESVAMQNVDQSIHIMQRLADYGVELSIDDFGTGYSSLSYLSRFPIHRIKIDRSFVTEVDKNDDNAEITRAIIDLGHNLSLKVIAEGVERDEELALLRSQGCDEVQGFLYSKPLPADQATEFLASY